MTGTGQAESPAVGGPGGSFPQASTAALSRFHPIPAQFARYEIDPDEAARVTTMSTEDLVKLADSGMPHAIGADERPLFDYLDLLNLAMTGSTTGASVPEMALRFLLRFAAEPSDSWYRPLVWHVSVRVPPSALARSPAPSRLHLQPPDLTAPGVAKIARPQPRTDQSPDDQGQEMVVRLTGRPGQVVSAQARDVFEEMRECLRTGLVTYQAVSEPLRMNHHLAWQLGMADCVVVARLMADRLRAAGLRARARRGYLLGLIGSDHSWCELYENGWWKPLDLVFAYLTTHRAQTLGRQPTEEFAAACLGSRFNRLLPYVSDEANALIYLAGEPAPPWALAAVSSRPGRT